MLHSSRIWMVTLAESAEDLARKLTESTWTGCAAFQLDRYLFANDSTSADGAQEYAVLRPDGDDDFEQIESVTFSWCSPEEALDLIRKTLAGQYDANGFCRVDRARFQTSTEHDSCHLCA